LGSGRWSGRGAVLGVALGVGLLALLPRVPAALRGFWPTNDGVEYLLLARSLARGEGFRLPIRVRFHRPGPVVHGAFDERAPLWPALLALPVAGGVGARGWPGGAVALLGCGLGAAAAALATGVGAALARRRGLRGRSALWAALVGGVTVALAPGLVTASLALWAEPLAVALALGAVWVELARRAAGGAADSGPAAGGAAGGGPAAAGGGGRRVALAAGLGLVVGLARFARPEAWVLVPLALVWVGRRGERAELAALAVAVGLVNAVGVGLSGVLAPQLFLLETADYRLAMDPAAAPRAPGAGDVALGVLGNLWGQAKALLLPRRAGLTLVLALLAWRSRAARPLLAAAGALVLATAGVWATADATRFTLAPLCLLAPVAGVELEARRKRWAPGRGWPLALYVAGVVGLLGHHAGEPLREGPPPAPAGVVARAGAPALADPWGYALVTGRPATLAPGSGR